MIWNVNRNPNKETTNVQVRDIGGLVGGKRRQYRKGLIVDFMLCGRKKRNQDGN